MKKYFTVIIFSLFLYNVSYSQTRQGNFVLSGGTDINLLFSNLDPHTNEGNNNRIKAQDYTINAGLGYFIFDNLAINISTSYEYSYSRKQLYSDAQAEEDIQNTLGLIPSVTYYFPVKGDLKPTVSLGAGYISMKERNNQQFTTPGFIVYRFGGLSLTAVAGASYFLNQSVSIDLGFQYSRNKLNDKINKNRSQLQNIYGVLAGLSVYF